MLFLHAIAHNTLIITNVLKYAHVCPGMVQLQPSYGSMLGGTGVMVKFQSQLPEIFEEIICTFDGIEVNGTLVNSMLALCVSPQLSKAGRVPFVFRIPAIDFIFESSFTSCKCTIVSMHTLRC